MMRRRNIRVAAVVAALPVIALAGCSDDGRDDGGTPGVDVAPSQQTPTTPQSSAPQSSTPAEGSEMDAARDAAFTGSVPSKFKPSLLRAASVCNQVDAPFLAALAAAQTGFKEDAVSGDLSGPFLLSPEAVQQFGYDEDRDGKVDPKSFPDAVLTAARMACTTAGRMDTAAQEGALDQPVARLALSMLYGEDPATVNLEQTASPLYKSWEHYRNDYSKHGFK